MKQGDPLGKIAIIPDAHADQLGRVAACAPRRSRSTTRSASSIANEALFKQGVVAEAELHQVPHRLRARASRSRDRAARTSSSSRRARPAARARRRRSIVTATVDGHGDRRAGQGRLLGDPGEQLQPRHHDRDDRRHGRHDLRWPRRRGRGREDQGGHEARRSRSARSRRTRSRASSSTSRRKGKEIDGAIQFEIKAAIVKQKAGMYIRAELLARTPTSCSTRRSRCSRSARRWSSTTRTASRSSRSRPRRRRSCKQRRQARPVRRHQGRGARRA